MNRLNIQVYYQYQLQSVPKPSKLAEEDPDDEVNIFYYHLSQSNFTYYKI